MFGAPRQGDFFSRPRPLHSPTVPSSFFVFTRHTTAVNTRPQERRLASSCDTIPSGTEPLFLFLALGTPVWAPCKAGYHPLLAGIPTWAPIVRAHALPAWWAGPTWLLPIVGRDTTTICTACAAYTRREPSYNALGAFRCTKDEITPESVMHKDPAA